MGENPGLSPVKLALAELREMRARIEELERERSAPIAIVGLAGRFPGAGDAGALWELLRDGRDGIVDVPADRWDVAAFFDEDPDAPGKMYTRRGGFLPEVDRFDAHFFGVSPREAVSMDPQQRLLLETAWRALEDAGIAPARLAGTQAGVFVGLSNIDYYRMAFADRGGIDAYYGSGTSGSVAAGRISYVLGLRGPSLVVDTACSSSLVAAHLACQSLRNKECSVALAGGVNLILSPDINIACSKAHMMSEDGLCKTFDARADGYVRSEGCAVVVLKRLEDAQRDGDRVLAVIRGSAVNQDGRSSGLTVPNGPAQEAVIRRALEAAGVEPHEIGYVEAHGTGTALGDPIEVRALGRVFADRHGADPLAIGSIKANVGHLEAAAGIAGLVKVVLALQHGTIPGHPHLGDRNPHLDWESLPLTVLTSPQPWPPGARRRIAGLSSFGFSGTNAHAIIEEAPAPAPVAATVERTRHILTLSARTTESLDELAAEYVRFLRAAPEDTAMGDVCMSANAGRSHFAQRLAVVGATAHGMADALASAGDSGRQLRGAAESSPPDVVFLFTGQGAQYAGMAKTLYQTHPAFRETLDECDRLLRGTLEPSLLTVLMGDERAGALLAETRYAQPALFAVEYALAELWRSWGVEPAAVLGHSVGEFAAACVAGVFSLEEGLRLIAERGRLMQSLPDAGAMAAVFADEATVRRALAGREAALAVAAVNGPDQVVISGERQAIRDVTAQFAAQSIEVRDLAASRAFHSPLLDSVLEPFGRAAAAVTFAAPRIPLVSNLTGEVATEEDLVRADYWTRHARQPVQFHRGIETLRRRGHTLFIEIGPSPTLVGMARRFADAPEVRWLPSLGRNRDDWDAMLTSLAAVYVAGANIDWAAFDRDYARRRTPVPGYRFQRQRYWLSSDDSATRPSDRHAGGAGAVHPLLGRRIESPLSDVLFDSRLGPGTVPFLSQHRVFGSLVFPATGYLEMAVAAAGTLGEGTPVVDDLVIAEALTLPDTGDRTVQAVVTPKADGDAAFQVFSRTSEGGAAEWHLHASATLGLARDAAAPTDTLSAARARSTVAVSPAEHYDLFQRSGLEYGPAFRGIVELWRGKDEAAGSIRLPDDTAADGYTLHPALLDSCFHVLLAALPDGAQAFTGRHFYLPVTVERLRVHGAAGAGVWAHARVRPIEGDSPETFTGDLIVFGADGAVVATVDGLTAKRASAAALKGATERVRTDWLYQVAWEPKPIAGGASVVKAGDVWAVLADDTSMAAALTVRFEQSGARVIAWDGAQLTEPVAGIACLWTNEIGESSLAAIEAVILRTSDAILALARESRRIAAPPRLVIATRGAAGHDTAALAYAPLAALARAFGAEHPEIRCTSVDLAGTEDGVERLWNEIASPDGEDQVSYQVAPDLPAFALCASDGSAEAGSMSTGEGGKVGTTSGHAPGERRVARLRPAPAAADRAANRPVRLAIAERGILDNLRLEPLERRAPGPGEIEIEVAASGLNFRDVLNALGMYPGDPGALGNECVGVVTAVGPAVVSLAVGARVLALVHGGFQSYAVAPADWAVQIPAGMDFEAAATIPMAFATAEYSLTRLAALRRGERVLIHAATGGVGLAAVQIAQRAGAEIFATAGSDEKRAFLTSLGIRHVMNSRTVAFGDEILAATNGEGVDVVLNSLTGDAIEQSIAALRPNGRFVEIGKRGIWTAEQVAAARPDVAYHTVFLGNVEDATIQSVLRDLAAAFAAGALHPLPLRTFSLADAVDGFRHMAQAKHIGKIVLTHDRAPRTAARAAVRDDASYLITGGFGGLGLRIARALVGAGARHLVLVGRNSATDAARSAVSELESAGAQVLGISADVSSESDAARVFAEAASHMPPLAGVVHAAGVRDDGVLAQMDRTRFDAVMAPKVAGAWNLHRATERLDLDFFVMFSSAAALLPSPAQGNYAAANAFLDALAHYRRARSLPALSINWGPWAEVGMAAGLSGQDQRRWARHGVQFIGPEDGVRAFLRLLGGNAVQVAVVAADWRKFAEERAGGIPLLAALAGRPAARSAADAVGTRPALLDQLESAAANRRRDVVLLHVREQVRQVLALEASFNLDPQTGLRDLGMDSLMALELRNRLQRSVGRPLPATLTFDRPTVAALAAYLADLLDVKDEAAASAAPVHAQPQTVREPGTGVEPIAVVGIGCRLPGGVEDSEAFWQLLHDGVDAIREVPRDRWDVDAYYSADQDAPGKMYTRFGGFIDRVDGFDPAFFSISPREAVSLDPQQRLLLEVAWEALEHGGQPADRLLGTRSGVFMGISTYDYALLHMKLPNPAAMDTYFGTGTSLSVAAGRLAYSLGLQGPCMAIDTACSSSLVAIHLACKSLRDRECRLALAGGVNLMLTPEPTVNGCRAHMLAPDGRCKTFDASADGYVRGEGAGVVVLKRLSDAIADGDTVLALIRGTAVNQDGRSSGLTVPNGPSQQSVIRDALENAGVQPLDVGYVEAHGTGTSLGDPIEIEALRSVLVEGRPADRPLVVGSVKTNIGHLEAAAGVAGLIKVIMAMRHGEIPPHLHFQTLNPHIALGGAAMVIPTESRQWSAGARRRIAGISSFGFSGTNAHIVVEEAPSAAAAEVSGADRPMHVLALSAKSDEALRDLTARYADALAATTEPLADVAFTANAGRTHFAHRVTVVAQSAGAASSALRERMIHAPRPAAAIGEASGTEPQIAFLFTGQGSQYRGMGRQLFETQPVFRAAMTRCDDLLRSLLDVPLLSVLYGDDDAAAALLNQTAYTQPALFAVEFSLMELWRSWGVRPAAVVGHSVGEYVAACAAGVFSLEDGLRLVAARARLMQALPPGSMAAVFASEADVAAALQPFGSALSIAAINGPEHIVISGETAPLEAVVARLTARGLSTQPLVVSHAFHSAAMEPMLAEFERLAGDVAFGAATLPVASNLTGQIAGPEIGTAAYWRDHVRQPVRFADGLARVREQGCGLFLEIGPRATLLGMARRAADIDASACLASLGPPREDWAQMLDSVAALYAAGSSIDWAGFDRPYARRKVTAPTYPFQRERYWIADQPGSTREEQSIAVPRTESCEIAWRAAEGAAAANHDWSGGWLVLADADGLGAEFARRVQQGGGACLLAFARSGQPISEPDSRVFYLDPEVPSHFQELVSQAVTQLGSIRGVVDLWGAGFRREHTVDSLQDAQALGCGALLHLVQSITTQTGFEGARLFVVTRGVCPTGDGVTPDVAQAPLRSLAQVVAVEQPHLGCTAIDLDPANGATDLDAIAAEMFQGPGARREDQIALRNGVRLAPRLVRSATAVARDRENLFRPDATYVLTGGMGALGLSIARHAVNRGARHLVLVGRRPPSPDAEALLLDLGTAGARITIARGDVADTGFVEALFSSLDRTHPAIRGVIHAAGIIDDGVIEQQDWDRFKRVLAPKVAGAWNLHAVTRDRQLDFFALFSSMASVIGSAGQSNYAAANGFLDGLAHYRRSMGLSATSINWGPWAEAGMGAAVDASGRARWSERGLTPLPPAAALDAFERTVAEDRTQCGVLMIDWARYAARTFGSAGAPSILQELVPVVERAAARPEVHASAVELRPALANLPAGRRRDLIRARVREEVVRVMGLKSEASLADAQGLRDLGLDSLMAVELRNGLQKAVGERLPATLAFDCPTVDALTGYLAAEVFHLDAGVGVTEIREVARPDDAIAIVGVGCRMPGGADGPEAFWRLLRDGVDAISEVPPDRWDVDDLYDSDPAVPGKMQSRWGGFLRDIDAFDPQFFGIAPREAVFMDPQQRLLLEVSWEALEHAGQAPERLAGSRTGVFVGVSTYDYMQLALNGQDRTALDPYVGTGNSPSVAAGRLSYVFGLQGPSMSVDTACSSSLVALHLACQSLRSGECRLALAGGVNLVLLPESNIILSKARMLSPDGRCKTFDASANGYVRGDGCGIVVLKRLSDAIADRDRILAVVRGTAVNQDGRSSGLTVPNGPAQEALIRDALAAAKVTPADVVYLEAHGTGTPLGDPIEVRALSAVLGEGRPADEPLIVGSIKTNVGHLEAAAGIAGIIKVVLAMKHGTIPAHLHFREPNPHIPWQELPIVVPSAAVSWPAGRRRIAGVSSFGFSGTNAHAVIEEPPAAAPAPAGVDRPLHVLGLSARSAGALRELAARYAGYLASSPPDPFADMCFTANAGRSHFEHRLAVHAADAAAAGRALGRFVIGGDADGLVAGEAQSSGRSDTAFLFPGTWTGMTDTRVLFETQPAFRRALERCQQLLEGAIDTPLFAILYPESGAAALLDDPRYAQPALFAVEYALAELWRGWGVLPSAVLGEGVGEYAAACAAGVFSLEIGLALSDARGRVVSAKDPGAVAAFERLAREVVFEAPQLEMVLGATGEVATLDGLRQMIAPSMQPPTNGSERSASAFETLHRLGCRTLVEVGPGCALVEAARETVADADVRFFASLRGSDVWRNLLAVVAELYVHGAPVDWLAFDREYVRDRVDLPTYPFERQRYWLPGKELRRTRATGDVDSVFHSVEWRPAEPSSARSAATHGPGSWVIFIDRGGAGVALADQLRQQGDRTLLVAVGEPPHASHGPALSIDQASTEAIARVWRDAIAAKVPDVRGVVYLWPLDEPAGVQGPAGVNGCDALLGVIQAMLRSDASARLPLWITTRGACSVSGEMVDPAQSPVWGLARTAALEHADLRTVLIDVGSGAGAAETADAIRTELHAADTENQIAYRDGARFMARLVAGPAMPEPVPLRRDATYLITGGTGGLGLAVARRMAERGAGSIVLMSRRAPSDEALAAIAACEVAGAAMAIVQGDIARREDVTRVMELIARDLPPLRGVVHAAGVLDDGLLLHQDAARLEKVFAPKVTGSWHLHDATRGTALDFFVLFSSIASVVGSPGQSGYSAANAFLDGLSHHRRALGLPATSVNWGPWAETGMGAAGGDANRRRWALSGIRPLQIEQGLAAFERCLGGGPPQVTVLSVDWPRCAASFAAGAEPPLLRDIARSERSAEPVADAVPELLRLLAAATSEAPLEIVRAHVTAQLRVVMGLDPNATPDPRKGLTEIGLDSLMALDLRGRLQKSVGRILPSTLAFDYPSIEALANHLLACITGTSDRAADDAPSAVAATGDDVLLAIEGLSDDQVEHLLAGRGSRDGV